MQRNAAVEARATEEQPVWALREGGVEGGPNATASERELALELMERDLDGAEAEFARARQSGGAGVVWPEREYWYEVEQRVKTEEGD